MNAEENNLEGKIRSLVLNDMKVHIFLIDKNINSIYKIDDNKSIDYTSNIEKYLLKVDEKDIDFCRNAVKRMFNSESTRERVDIHLKDNYDKNVGDIYHIKLLPYYSSNNSVDYVIANVKTIHCKEFNKITRESLLHHSFLLDYFPSGIMLFDNNGRVFECNKSAKEFSRSRFNSEINGINIFELNGFNEEQLHNMVEHIPFKAYIRFPLTTNAISDIKHPDFSKENLYCNFIYNPIYDKDSCFVTNMVIIQYMTENLVKKHQDEINQKLIELIFNRYRIVKFDYFPQDKTYSINKHGCSNQCERLPLSTALNSVHNKNREECQEIADTFDWQSGKSISFKSVIKFAGEYKNSDVIVSLFPEYNENGIITNYTGIVRDITQETIEHRHLLQYQRKTEILNRKYKMTLWNLNPDDLVLRSDNSWQDNEMLHDYTYEKMLSILHPDYVKPFKNIANEIHNRTFNLVPYITCIRFPNGKYHYLQFVPEVLKDDEGQIVRYLFICRDVTEEKEIEFKQKNYIEHIHRMTEECGIRLFYYTPGTNILRVEDPLADKRLQEISVEEYLQSVHEDDVETLSNYIESLNRKKVSKQEIIYRLMPFSDNVYHRYRTITLPVLNEKGELIKYGAIRIDITKEYENQEMLRFSQDIGQIGSWLYDVKTKRHIWTDEMFKILEIQKSDNVSFDDYKNYIYPDDLDAYIKAFKKSYHEGKNFTLNFRVITPKGKIKIVEIRTSVEKGKSNETYVGYGTLMDITDRNKMKEEKEEAHAILSTILKSLPTMVFIKDIDNDFRFMIANDVFAKMFGVTTEDVIGKKESEFAKSSIEAICRESDMKAISHIIDNPLIMIEEFPDKESGHTYLQSIKFVQNIRGKKLLMCAATNVTELQNAKSKAEESDRLKSAFLANMSHEIRTPLNAIVGFSDMIVSNVSPGENKMFMNVIQSNTDHLLRLIGDILDLSSLEANVMKFIYTDFNLNDMLHDTYNTMKNKFADKELQFIYKPQSNLLIVHQDRVRISEIITNFLTNALKNTTVGAVTLWAEHNDKTFTIYVKDTGKGIPEDKVNLIFERFEKLDNFMSGTGLGLTVCKAIAEALNGRIGVRSKIDYGSLFWVELPITINKPNEL